MDESLDDRVWIMDPSVLEDSARDSMDSSSVQSAAQLQPQPFQLAQMAGGRLPNGGMSNEPKPFEPLEESYVDPPMPPANNNNCRAACSVGADPTHREPDLTLVEKQFLLSAERGDMASVKVFLELALAKQRQSPVNINCVDPLGRTALLIAIENENIEMIEVLLENNCETGDALLYAINEENVEAVEIILYHLEKVDKFNSENQGVDANEHSAFTPDITPIILAAHRDNYEIIKLLLDRGASIPHPHDVRCACKECLQASAEDSLRLSRSRINAYRALASPSLICLSARDPILYAFELSWELRRLSTIENEFKMEYQELSQKCQKFAVDLLDQTRGSKELEIILNHDTTDRIPFKERTHGERMQLSRLKLAIQFRQKRFVAHPNCQQLLASIWYEGLPGFRRRNIVFKVLLILGVSLAFPFLCFFYLVAPKSTMGLFMRKPFIKFLCHSASYCTFLFLLILASQRLSYDFLFTRSQSQNSTEPKNQTSLDSDVRKETRGPAPTPVEWAIMAWVAGLIWTEIKQLWDVGLYEYCHNMWNMLDFITNSLYLSTVALRLIAYAQVEMEGRDGNYRGLGRSIQRKEWDAWDPTLISECIFATANIFSSLKLVHIFTVNPHLGPLQISLGRMIIDIMKFFFVYSLVLFAFACGLNQLMWYYATMRANDCKTALKIKKETGNKTDDLDSCEPKYNSFASLFNTVETLFWAIFGLVDLENFHLKEDHFITEWAGKTMFGTYGVISIVVLLNMLIAMMSNSYQYISNQQDAEWKFARSKLWIEYFEEGGTLPAPFNIIPSPKSIIYLCKYLCERFCHCSRRMQQKNRQSLKLQKILKAVSLKEANYQFVMRNLIKRYVAHVQRQKQQAEGVSEDDVNEIKQDISAFRYELLEILRNAGFNTGHANISQKTNYRNKRRSAQAERRLMKGFQTNVEPIPELDRYLPKLAGMTDEPDKSASVHSGSPGPAKVSQRFKRLSKKIPIGNSWREMARQSQRQVKSPLIAHAGSTESQNFSSSMSRSNDSTTTLTALEMENLNLGQQKSAGDHISQPPYSSTGASRTQPQLFPQTLTGLSGADNSGQSGPGRLPAYSTSLGQTRTAPKNLNSAYLWRTISTDDAADPLTIQQRPEANITAAQQYNIEAHPNDVTL